MTSLSVVLDRIGKWTRRAVFGEGAPDSRGFYREHWRPVQEDAAYAELTARYGEDRAATEVAILRSHLLREVVYAACGFVYTLDKLEHLVGEVQEWVEEHVARPGADDPEPEFGRGVGHPNLVYASFEFMNLLGWLRTIDERLDRATQRPGERLRAGLVPALAEDRALRPRVEELVCDFRARALERKLANYVLHAEAVPGPWGGGNLARDNTLSISIPDRAEHRIGTRHALTYTDGRDALAVAREASQAVEALIDGLIDAFIDDGQAIAAERAAERGGRGRSP